MSCSTCVNQGKRNCDPAPNERGGCDNYRRDKRPDESDNGNDKYNRENESEEENG